VAVNRRGASAAWGLLAFALVLWCGAFVHVWLGSWDLEPDAYGSAQEWWSDFARPRAARSLIVTVPIGMGAASLVRRAVANRHAGGATGPACAYRRASSSEMPSLSA